MSSVVLSGDTSGTVTLTVPSVAGTNTVTIPAVTGTAVIAGQNSAITASTAQASTSGTSIDFTGIPSWVKRVTVMLNGVSTNGSSLLQIQIGAGSVTTTGYVSSNVGGTTGNILAGNTATTGFAITNVTSAAYNASGSFVIATIGSNTWIETGILITETAANAYMSSGRITLGGTLDRVRITTVNGTDTFDAGSINILYE